ncbi:MAG: IPTL-CTERM sorting domain-containing protein [Bacteroidota bacterium]
MNYMFYSLRLGLLLFGLFSSLHSSHAQCFEPVSMIPAGVGSLPNAGSPNPQVGSSFIACNDGAVMSLAINFAASNVGNAAANLIFRDVAMAGRNVAGTTQEYIQVINVSGGGGIQTFTLTTPYPVKGGETYAWLIETPTAFEISTSTGNGANLYPNGGAMNNAAFVTPSPLIDLVFQVEIAASESESNTPIPTMSQWGLLIFALLIMNLSVFYVQRRALI